jgi:hypothetical protein
MTVADLGLAYLELVLRLGKLSPWMIDGHAGPAAPASRVQAETTAEPARLIGHATPPSSRRIAPVQ